MLQPGNICKSVHACLYLHPMTATNIGKTIRKARGERSLRCVAREARVESSQVKRVEQGVEAYTITTLLAVSKAVGVTITAK